MQFNDDFYRAFDVAKAGALTGTGLSQVKDALTTMEDIFRRAMRELRDLSLPEYDGGVDPPSFTAPASPVETVLATAEAEWSRGVREPVGGVAHGRLAILEYIKDGLGWAPPANYTNGSFHWCGAFVAFCWAKAGMLPELRKYWMPSCNRQYYGHSTRGHWPRKNGGERVVYTFADGGELQPGDIVMVGDHRGRPSGSHVTLCAAVRADHIETYEGNARGNLPGGVVAEGVVKQRRYFHPGGPQGNYVIMWAWRPKADDLVEGND